MGTQVTSWYLHGYMVGVRNEHGLDNSQKWEVLKWGPMWYLDLKLLWESGRNTCCSSNSERIIFKKLEVVKWEPRWHHDTCMVGMGGKKEHRLDNSQKWEVLKWAPRWYLDILRNTYCSSNSGSGNPGDFLILTWEWGDWTHMKNISILNSMGVGGRSDNSQKVGGSQVIF